MRKKMCDCNICRSNQIIENFAIKRVEILNRLDKTFFRENVFEKQIPFLIKGYTTEELGTGILKDRKQLKEEIGNMRVSVHVSESPLLDFVNKNFVYKFIKIEELYDLIEQGAGGNAELEEKEKSESRSPREIVPEGLTLLGGNAEKRDQIERKKTYYYYYRSLGQRPQKDPSNLKYLSEKIYRNFNFPFFNSSSPSRDIQEDMRQNSFLFHSSVLRISQSNIQLWTHYDLPHNFLVVVKGYKRVFLFPPNEVFNLKITESSSPIQGLITGIKEIDKLENVTEALKNALYVDMEEEDILFIPSCWLHSIYTHANENCSKMYGKEQKLLCNTYDSHNNMTTDCQTINNCENENKYFMGKDGKEEKGREEKRSAEACVSVNVFFFDLKRKDLLHLYQKNDPYGNKDLTIASDIFKKVDLEILKIRSMQENKSIRKKLADYILNYSRKGSLEDCANFEDNHVKALINKFQQCYIPSLINLPNPYNTFYMSKLASRLLYA